VIAYASAGDFGGFIPTLDLAKLARYFRAAIVAFFLQCSLIGERLARSMLE